MLLMDKTLSVVLSKIDKMSSIICFCRLKRPLITKKKKKSASLRAVLIEMTTIFAAA